MSVYYQSKLKKRVNSTLIHGYQWNIKEYKLCSRHQQTPFLTNKACAGIDWSISNFTKCDIIPMPIMSLNWKRHGNQISCNAIWKHVQLSGGNFSRRDIQKLVFNTLFITTHIHTLAFLHIKIYYYNHSHTHTYFNRALKSFHIICTPLRAPFAYNGALPPHRAAPSSSLKRCSLHTWQTQKAFMSLM